MYHLTLFLTAFNAVAPIILLILLGYGLKRKGFLTPEFLRCGNWLVFHVCLPCMLFVNVYNISGFSAIRWDIICYCLVMLTVLFLLGLGTALITTPEPSRRSVIWMCTYRSNFAVIGLSLAGAIASDAAMAIAAVVSSFTIPLFNVFAVISLSVFSHREGSASLKEILNKLLHNPMLIGIALGMVCLGLRELQQAYPGDVLISLRRDTPFLYTALSHLKAVTTPLALMVLGGQFEFTAVRGLRKEIAVGTIWRTVLSPLLGIGGAALLSAIGWLACGPEVYPALIALFGSPMAITCVVMAGSMGGDEQLATQLVVWTSLISVVTIFLQVYLLLSIGLLPV